LAEGDEVVETGIEEAEDIEALQQALAEEKEKAERYLANWQRSQADLQNYAKRAEQEKSETVEFANRMLIMDLLPILDDFERALTSLPGELDGQNWTEGIRLIYFHEAAGQVDGEEDTVIEELRKGYQFKGKLLRPSTVMVGTGKEIKNKEVSSEER
jgi:molecular chaperone GrpE